MVTTPVLLLQAALLGLVEGVTEFLPVSSTGHLILVADWLDFWSQEKREVFEIAVQLGAILAVCWEYRVVLTRVILDLPRTRAAQGFALNVVVAFLPAAVLGLLFGKLIKAHLFNPVTVASALIVGGVVILWAERVQRLRPRGVVTETAAMTTRHALLVGLAQCLALVPGTSRSAATVVGGLFTGLSRQVAVEFSFFLAIPTLFAATLYDTYKHRGVFEPADLPVFGVGLLVAFLSALLVIRAFIRYVGRRDLTPFAWYRIAFGALVLVLALSKT